MSLHPVFLSTTCSSHLVTCPCWAHWLRCTSCLSASIFRPCPTAAFLLSHWDIFLKGLKLPLPSPIYRAVLDRQCHHAPMKRWSHQFQPPPSTFSLFRHQVVCCWSVGPSTPSASHLSACTGMTCWLCKVAQATSWCRCYMFSQSSQLSTRQPHTLSAAMPVEGRGQTVYTISYAFLAALSGKLLSTRVQPAAWLPHLDSSQTEFLHTTAPNFSQVALLPWASVPLQLWTSVACFP